MSPYNLQLFYLSRPIYPDLQRQPEAIHLITSRLQAHPFPKNTAQYDAYLNTIFIYIWLPERFYNAFLKFSPIDARDHDDTSSIDNLNRLC